MIARVQRLEAETAIGSACGKLLEELERGNLADPGTLQRTLRRVAELSRAMPNETIAGGLRDVLGAIASRGDARTLQWMVRDLAASDLTSLPWWAQ